MEESFRTFIIIGGFICFICLSFFGLMVRFNESLSKSKLKPIVRSLVKGVNVTICTIFALCPSYFLAVVIYNAYYDEICESSPYPGEEYLDDSGGRWNPTIECQDKNIAIFEGEVNGRFIKFLDTHLFRID
jgi:hypothetical protein